MESFSCIALDVSKNSSRIGVFDYNLKHLFKVVVINHSLQGFGEILKSREIFVDSVVVIETTGVLSM